MVEPETHSDYSGWLVECAGEGRPVPVDRSVTVGRGGDLVIDDNPHLHRRLIDVQAGRLGLAWITNVGSHIPLTVVDDSGLLRATLAPGGRMLAPARGCRIEFAAGPTRYDVRVWAPAADAVPPPLDSPRAAAEDAAAGDLDDTVTCAPLAPAQRLLLVALAEPVLRGDHAGPRVVPSTAAAAARLGWTPRAFTRRLDHVCRKLGRAGAPGLASSDGRVATHRRIRLVEYAVATRLVTPDDLALLPPRPSTR